MSYLADDLCHYLLQFVNGVRHGTDETHTRWEL